MDQPAALSWGSILFFRVTASGSPLMATQDRSIIQNFINPLMLCVAMVIGKNLVWSWKFPGIFLFTPTFFARFIFRPGNFCNF